MNALVISGGGPKGSFAAGAIKRLFEAGRTYDAFYGTSTGALIAPFAAIGEIELLERMYTTIRPEQIYKKRWLPLALLRHPGLYSMEPLRRLLRETLTEEMYERICEKKVAVSTYNLHRRVVEYWFAWEYNSRLSWIECMIASASIPIISDPVDLYRGQRYVDGGVRDHTPLAVAIHNGATDITAIVLTPDMEQYDPEVKGMAEILLRCLEGLSAAGLEKDLMTCDAINGQVASPGYDGEYKWINLEVIRLRDAYVGGVKWTVEAMQKQFDHGYDVAGEVV